MHWGRYGAAGLLLCAPLTAGTTAVLLQHRAEWSHHGDTWGLPGGALDSHETPEEAALREAYEEAGLASERLQVRHGVVTAEVRGPGDMYWSYTTVVADAPETLLVYVPGVDRDRDRQRDRRHNPVNAQQLRRSPRHSPRESEQALLAFLQVTAQQPEYWNDQVGDLLDIAAARVQQAAFQDDSSDSDC
jgi:8-oxo-dGTP pyrophosphatase MutT (NUDIX family)